MTKALPHIAAMSPYALADLGGPDMVSLAQNESAFPPSPAAIQAGKAALSQSHLYPDPDWMDLRAAIANVHNLSPSHILCGAGSMELIGALIRAFAGPGDQVLGTQYGYAFVATATQQAQATYVQADEPNLTVDIDAILNCVTPQTKLVFVCNPGNPTGTLIPNAELLRLRHALPQDTLLVIDQAYAEFADATQNPAGIFALAESSNTVITRTLSKAYGLAGARVGWGYFPPHVLTEVRKLLNPNNISVVSQVMATAAFADQTHMHKTVTDTITLRDRFIADGRALGLHIPESHTNFALIRFHSPQLAQAADMALRQANLLLRGMGGYGLPDCLRATICQAPVMIRVLDVLKGLNP